MNKNDEWLEIRWPHAGDGPGLPFVVQVFESEDEARASFPEGFELAYAFGDPDPFVIRQIMSSAAAIEDPYLRAAYVRFLTDIAHLLRWELEAGT